LRLFDERLQHVRHCKLREDWSRTRVDAGDFVHVTGAFDPDSGTCLVDNAANMIVVHPDCMLTGTRVADSFDCARKAVLSDRFSQSSGPSFAMLQGTMVHELFETAVTSRRFATDELARCVRDVVQKHLAAVMAAGETEASAAHKITEFVPLLQHWSRQFLRPDPVEQVKFGGGGGGGDGRPGGETHLVAVSQVLDIEENIWCPQFGIKGKVDASVEVEIHTVAARRPGQGCSSSGGRGSGRIISRKKVVAPLELKTGRVTARGMTSHRAQVILYMLMMDGRCVRNRI
jgi:DNA replication ATP-dependent helicase Dna2